MELKDLVDVSVMINDRRDTILSIRGDDLIAFVTEVMNLGSTITGMQMTKSSGNAMRKIGRFDLAKIERDAFNEFEMLGKDVCKSIDRLLKKYEAPE